MSRNLRVLVALGADAIGSLRLDAREFEFLAENLRELFHREIHFEDMRAGSVARRAGPARYSPFALADAVLALAEAEARQFDLRHRNADEVLPLLADHFAVGDVLLQVLLDASAHDLPEPKMILFDVKNHKDSPPFVVYSFASPRAKMLAT